jgi:hypothetical protein
MRYRHVVGVAVLVAGCLWCRSAAGDLSTADAAAIPKAPVSVVTPPPPTVTGEQTKTGIELNGSTNKTNRLKRDEPAQKRKKAAATSTNAKQSGTKEKPARPTSLVPRKDFRLNIGICGLREADGTTPGPERCQPVEPEVLTPGRRTVAPEVVEPPQPSDVTWEQILAESRVVLFPELSVKVQPKGRTLVNLDTIVYTDESAVSTNTVTLLGFPVVVEATPVSYRWNFGDGTPSLLTTTPGKPYPSKEITHKYLKRGSVGLTLTTNYAARFNVANTGWQYVDGLIPVTGPATRLQVREAVPVLVEPGG